MKVSIIGAFALSGFILTNAFGADAVKPKYGPMATRLAESHAYIQKNKAPDYWALSAYYLPQQWGGACSVASVAMVVNAARVHQKLTADDNLATQSKLLEKIKEPLSNGKTWSAAVGADGSTNPTGVGLDQLSELTKKSLEAYGVKVKKIDVVHADPTDKSVKAKLHKALVENEKSDSDFIIANFNQQAYTGDADAGHIAPVGAYDIKNKRVLVFDPDRDWYEPYWVSEETFLSGLATKDSSGKSYRGFIYVQLEK